MLIISRLISFIGILYNIDFDLVFSYNLGICDLDLPILHIHRMVLLQGTKTKYTLFMNVNYSGI